MSSLLKIILFLYNIIILFLGGIIVLTVFNYFTPTTYLDWAMSAVSNRIILGGIGMLLIVIALLVFINLFKGQPKEESITVENALHGRISMTIPAIKVIIHKSLQKVEGVKETKIVVKNLSEGLTIYIHMMINPELNVPELSKKVQETVKFDLMAIGGLEVQAVKVLIDDLGSNTRTAVN
jgi:uncharacterized alkaline shock family protein YloU